MLLNPKIKHCIAWCALSYPVSYIISKFLWMISNVLEIFYPEIFSQIDMSTCTLSLVVSINVISLIYAILTCNSPTDSAA